MTKANQEFSDYIVYVDESGSPTTKNIDKDYPLFVLAFCIFNKEHYAEQVVPHIQKFKFHYFGHDLVILHENEMNKQKSPFDFLTNPTIREEFYDGISMIIDNSNFSIVSVVIKKDQYAKMNKQINPYHLALEFGLERVFYFLQENGQRGKITHIVFESRGNNEDNELELEFRRILGNTNIQGLAESVEYFCVSKKSNSAGLQLADMVARPIGLKVLRPNQPNRALEHIEPKIRRSSKGDINGYGLKIYPR